jgi:xanthine/CO dehydrogenase XdhC/CoxF family maturation factor
LLDFYRNHRDEESLVLATIIATAGSTYRKPGAMMLISRDGSFEGMISGGCLEGDLLHHAKEVFDSGQVKFVTYDMHAGDDIVWNLGVGCDGVIHLMLQRLDGATGHGFLASLDASQALRKASLLALVTKPAPGLPAGAFRIMDTSDISVGTPDLQPVLDANRDPWPAWRMKADTRPCEGGEAEVILVNLPVPVRVLVCGAGPDAVPVARVLCGLDWEVVIVDHRPAFAKKERFPRGCEVIQGRPEHLSRGVALADIDAAIIMSHHLENDAAYLGQVAKAGVAYTGVLGPKARRERLAGMAGCDKGSLYGPAGLDIGAELPEAIALSIVAEIHAVLNGRNGLPLTRKANG